VALAHVDPHLLPHASLLLQTPKFAPMLDWLEVGGASRTTRRILCAKSKHGNVPPATGECAVVAHGPLLIPKLGRCGEPSVAQIYWLRQRVRRFLQRPPAGAARSTRSSTATDGGMLVLRRVHRTIPHAHASIERAAHEFATARAISVTVFSDAKESAVGRAFARLFRRTENTVFCRDTPLREQLAAFERASVVVAPHGAGLVNLVAARRGACVLELLDIDGWPILIYMRLAYLLGLQYMALPARGNATEMKEAVAQGLRQCSLPRPGNRPAADLAVDRLAPWRV
jgi:hypothetical protein